MCCIYNLNYTVFHLLSGRYQINFGTLWHTTKRCLQRIIERSLGVSCKTCFTRRIEEPIWRRNYISVRSRHDVPLRPPLDVPVRCIDNIPLRRCWVFVLRVVWDVVGTYPLDVVRTFLHVLVETYQWDLLATYHWDVIGCFVWDVTGTSLGRIERRFCDVATTSPCRVSCFFNFLDSFVVFCKWSTNAICKSRLP